MKGGTSGTGDGRSPQAEYSAQPPEAALSARANAGRPAGRDSSGLVYIASPYAGDVERNTEFAKAACRYAMECGQTPVAVHLLYPQFLRDSDPAEREAGLKMGHQILAVCDSLWLCGDRISEGMAREMDEAKRLGIPIREVSTQEIEGGISIEQQDLITEKLYSPLNFYLRDNDMLEEYDDVNYWRDELPHEEAWECMDQIELAIRRNRDTLNPERGMMKYYRESESVNGKVQSLFPNIELRGDQLWCVADMKLTAPLTAEETAELKGWWCGQLSDGWGEGFEQQEIKVARGELYIEPWTSEKSFFIATEREFCKRLGLELSAEKPLPTTGEKPSVLAQLRETKTAPTAVQPHKKSEPER